MRGYEYRWYKYGGGYVGVERVHEAMMMEQHPSDDGAETNQ
jgi:hypothetical protein